ncbi:MAG TPA: cytochrome c oxidase accessory protein CcoG [Xanthomonadales bacterium]|nr:cytochrome c oxidase accessory protein CcoG [Xanthomonadales bacterium]
MTEQASGDSLYRKEPKIYPRQVTGRFARLRVLAVWVLLGLYYLLPWITVNGRQAVLFDLPARKFYIFGLTFWPQDFVYLALLLIAAGLSLFFFTALAGRLWCGFACPQTVWTETFIWIERWVEGDRQKRMKLDAAPWNAEKILRKSAKQALWILFAAWTGFTFVGFFSPIRELGSSIFSLSLGPWETFWTVFYGFATNGNAGFLREQVCKYMCPYARFQSAMFDKDTLIISYDSERGEPRGGRRKNTDKGEAGLGDCINCTLCVQVCPTGIDIRDGLQYECIACAACIDVCDQVMDRMEYPRGLVRYTTEHALKHRTGHVIRPRIIVYGLLLLAIISGTLYGMTHRVPLRADLIRDRNALYRELPGDVVENVYTLKITNMDTSPHRYDMSVLNNAAVEIDLGRPLELGPEEVAGISVRLRLPRSAGQGVQHLDIGLQASDDPSIRKVIKAKAMMPIELGNQQ